MSQRPAISLIDSFCSTDYCALDTVGRSVDAESTGESTKRRLVPVARGFCGAQSMCPWLGPGRDAPCQAEHHRYA